MDTNVFLTSPTILRSSTTRQLNSPVTTTHTYACEIDPSVPHVSLLPRLTRQRTESIISIQHEGQHYLLDLLHHQAQAHQAHLWRVLRLLRLRRVVLVCRHVKGTSVGRIYGREFISDRSYLSSRNTKMNIHQSMRLHISPDYFFAPMNSDRRWTLLNKSIDIHVVSGF